MSIIHYSVFQKKIKQKGCIKKVNFKSEILNKAKLIQKTIVLPEASFSERIRDAIKIILKNKIAKIIVVGEPNEFSDLKNKNNLQIICADNFSQFDVLKNKFFELRKEKGLTIAEAEQILKTNKIYFATMLVECGFADGLVCGAEVPTAETLKPVLQIIKGKNNQKVSSCFIMLNKKECLAFADCAIIPSPNSDELCCIAESSAKTFQSLTGEIPKVAFLSFSSLGSSQSEEAEKPRRANLLFRERNKNIVSDGEIQLDAALNRKVAEKKIPNSPISGDANVLVFPDLNSGNIGYKLYQIGAKATAVGPIIQGLNKPVNDLSRGCNINEIVLMVAITAVQADCK